MVPPFCWFFESAISFWGEKKNSMSSKILCSRCATVPEGLLRGKRSGVVGCRYHQSRKENLTNSDDSTFGNIWQDSNEIS